MVDMPVTPPARMTPPPFRRPRFSIPPTFSPYLDAHGLLDWLEDAANRLSGVVVAALLLHIALFFALLPEAVSPTLPDEPEALTVEIVTLDPILPEPVVEEPPAPASPVEDPIPAAPPPPPPPQPESEPAPPPPPPQPEPEPEPEPQPLPEPEPFIPPPPPEPQILLREAPTPDPVPLPPPPEPLPVLPPEPERLPDSIALPTREDLLPPEPEPLPEIPPEPEPEPLPPEPELLPDSIVLPSREDLLPPEPEPEPVVVPEPVVERLPDDVFLPSREDLQRRDAPPISDPVPESGPDPEPAPPETITTAPTILASPDAPSTREEADRAVPEEQAAPLSDLITGRRPPGTPSIGTPPASSPPAGQGGLRRGNPGAGGWQLAAPATQSPGEGYSGLVLDIRCREADRTHEDCPEYVRGPQGRNAAGYERFTRGRHIGSGNGGGISGTTTRAGIGARGDSIWSAGGGAIGSVNNGGPSTTVLDDTDFGKEFLNNPVFEDTPGSRLRDIVLDPEDDDEDDWALDLIEE